MIVEAMAGIAPLDAQLGIIPKKMVPDSLAQAVFPKPARSAAYALLDAMRIVNLPEILGASGLEHRCLFLSDSSDPAPDFAPWLVRLDPDAEFTRKLFTAGAAPWQLWTKDPALILVSPLGFQNLWQHLRRFTRVAELSGRRHFFRYWNHHVFLAWMTEIRDDAASCCAFFGTRTEPVVDMVLVRGAPGDLVFQVMPDAEVLAGASPQPFRLTGPNDPILRRALVRPLATSLVPQLRANHPALVADLAPLALELAVEDTLMRLHGYGFRRYDILAELVVQDLYLGYPFEDEDRTGRMRAVCLSDEPQETRYARLCEMIVALAGTKYPDEVNR